MSSSLAVSLAPEAIPVIDIEPLINGSDPAGVAKALHAASQDLGFIYVRGHGIADSIIHAARSQALDFFRREPADKQSVQINKRHRGWLASGGAKMHDDAMADLKESFVWGSLSQSARSEEEHPLRGANQWPAGMSDFQKAAAAWFNSAQTIAMHLMRGFAIGLQLPEGFFLQSTDRPLTRASMVYYPAQTARPGQFGVGPHTDFGVLTILSQDEVGGLQVRMNNGQWVHAPPIEGTLVVNVADLLSRWTAGQYVSTPHRVLNESGRERLSLVLAYDPNPETMIDARQVVGHSVETDAPISCGDYLMWRFNKAFNYRQSTSPDHKAD